MMISAKIEEEQKKLIEDLRESNESKSFKKYLVQAASKAFDQWNAQFDEISNRSSRINCKTI